MLSTKLNTIRPHDPLDKRYVGRHLRGHVVTTVPSAHRGHSHYQVSATDAISIVHLHRSSTTLKTITYVYILAINKRVNVYNEIVYCKHARKRNVYFFNRKKSLKKSALLTGSLFGFFPFR